MIRIDSIKRLDADNFEVEFVSNERTHTRRLEYTYDPSTKIDVVNSYEADRSHDAEFHNFIVVNPEFKAQLFRIIRQLIKNEHPDLPVEVEEGWPSSSHRRS